MKTEAAASRDAGSADDDLAAASIDFDELLARHGANRWTQVFPPELERRYSALRAARDFRALYSVLIVGFLLSLVGVTVTLGTVGFTEIPLGVRVGLSAFSASRSSPFGCRPSCGTRTVR